MEKRKKFDSKQKREVTEEQNELQKNNKRIQQTIDKKKKLNQSKWKKERENMKNMMKEAKTDEAGGTGEVEAVLVVKNPKNGKPPVN